LVLKSDIVSKRVLEYTPPKFELGTPEQAKSYLEGRMAKSNDFRMSDVIRVQTGVQKIEASNVEESVEQKVLDRLKEVQEGAYQEAYQLGLDEGRKEAFDRSTQDINARLSEMDQLFSAIRNLKKELIDQNESHLVQLAFHMAKRLAHIEVQSDPQIVVEVIRDAIEKAQAEEEVTVQVCPSQLEFLENLKSEHNREFDFLKKVRLEPAEGVNPGGCVIETNYGEIDARFEERVSKLWETVSENLLRVKGRISSK
jgi:flagellar assembly protein FliH